MYLKVIKHTVAHSALKASEKVMWLIPYYMKIMWLTVLNVQAQCFYMHVYVQPLGGTAALHLCCSVPDYRHRINKQHKITPVK